MAMATTIKLKNSTVLDKAPTTADIAVGELALNCNSGSPAAYIQDSAGNIVQIAGVGSVSTPDATETVKGIAKIATTAEVTAGTDDTTIITPAKLTAATPAAQDLQSVCDEGTTTTTGATFGGSLDIGGGNIELTAAGAITAASSITGNAFSSDANNGNVFSTTNGNVAITAAGEINAAGPLTVYDAAAGSATDSSFIIRNPNNTADVASINGAGVITATGAIISGGDPGSGANDGATLAGGSGVSASFYNGPSAIFRGYTTGNSTPTFKVTAAGAIDTHGGITSTGTSVIKSPSGSYRYFFEAVDSIGAELSLYNSSDAQTTRISAHAADPTFFGTDVLFGGAPGSQTATITAAGAITAADTITSNKGYYVALQSAGSGSTSLFKAWHNSDTYVDILDNGSITAAGDVKIGGTSAAPKITLTASGYGFFKRTDSANSTDFQIGIASANGAFDYCPAWGISLKADGAANNVGSFIGYDGTAFLQNKLGLGGGSAGVVRIELDGNDGSIEAAGGITSDRTSDFDECFVGKKNGTVTSTILADGSIFSDSTISSTGDLTVNTDALVVNAAVKKVGIGTTPSTNLHVAGSTTPTVRVENTGATGNANLELKLPSNTFTIGLNSTSTYFEDTAGNDYIWYHAGTETMRLSSSGALATDGTITAAGYNLSSLPSLP